MINFASNNYLPSIPLFPALSEPDKSTSYSFEWTFASDPCLCDSRLIIKMQWDQVDTSFIGVSDMALFVWPMKSKFNASSSV